MKHWSLSTTAVTGLAIACLWLCADAAPAVTPESDPTPTLPSIPEFAPPLLLNEKPLVSGAAAKIEFSGATTFNDAKLRNILADQLHEIQERGLTNPRADDTAYYLAVFYRKQGFPEAEVTWKIQAPRLLLLIHEGPRTYLRKLIFSGNKSLSESTLYEYMLGVKKERLKTEGDRLPFVLANAKAGVDRVRALYESEGFLDAAIEDPAVEISPDHSQANITIKITEGQRYTIGDISFAGETLFPRAKLLTGLGPNFQGAFTFERINTLQRNLQFFYKSQGYFQAEVEVASDPHQAVNGKVQALFTVTPKHQFTFDGITTKGEGRLKQQFLERRFASLHGKVYNPAQLDERYRELLRTGLFRTLRINSVAQDDHTVRLDLSVEEAKARELGFSLGGSSEEGIEVGLRLGDRNLFGWGRPLTFSLDVSSRTLRSDLLYVDPWLFDSNFSLRSHLYALDRDEIGYSKIEQGFRTDISRKLTKNIEVAAFVAVRHVQLTKVLVEPAYVGPINYKVDSVGLTQSVDYRDSPINPSKGWIFNSAFDLDSVSEQLAFARATARWSYYRPIGKNLSLALGARGGLILPFGDVPLDEHYFNGGATTVRSFRERTLGPVDKHSYPVGGEMFSVFNAELTFPLYGSMQGAAFVDAGNVAEKYNNFSFDGMRYAIGLGLRYKLPIGPLRLDFGANPAPKKDEDFGAYHFTFGFAF